MNKVTVKKSELLDILRKNKTEHREIFLKAQATYRTTAIDEMDQQLERARKGDPFVLSRITELEQPQDYTSQYERAIKMLEMSVDDTVEITTAEFANYVEDVWAWSRGWAVSSSQYVKDNPKLMALTSP